METNSNQHARRGSGGWLSGTGRGIAIAYGLIGFTLLLTAFDKTRLENERLLREPDLVLGGSGQSIVLLAAGAYLLASVLSFVVRNPISKSYLIFWITSAAITYQLGLARANSGGTTVLVLVADKLGMTPRTTLCLWLIFSTVTVIVGVVMLLREWRLMKQLRDQAFVEQYQQFREKGASAKP